MRSAGLGPSPARRNWSKAACRLRRCSRPGEGNTVGEREAGDLILRRIGVPVGDERVERRAEVRRAVVAGNHVRRVDLGQADVRRHAAAAVPLSFPMTEPKEGFRGAVRPSRTPLL